MSIPSGAVDLSAISAQQKVEREAKECGMADHHSVVVALAPGSEGMSVQMALVGTCATCLAMVRAEWWRKHFNLHQEAGQTTADQTPVSEQVLAKLQEDSDG